MNELNPNREGAEPSVEPVDGPKATSGPSQTAASVLPICNQPRQLALRILRAEAEMHAIKRALEQTGWNRRRAADLLSISYRGLLYKIRQYDITQYDITTTTALESVKVE
jgi:DNA-binding NtrC family response regulator